MPKQTKIDSEDWNTFQSELSALQSATKATGLVSDTPALTAETLQTTDPSKLGNDQSVEIQWVLKAVKHSQVYMSLVSAFKGKLPELKLTKYDDLLYAEFRSTFPHMSVEKMSIGDFKNTENLKLWRTYIEKFTEISDYNYGTMIRMDSRRDYDEDNTEICPRVQFYAIEIARNREGHNDYINQ